MSGRHAEEDGQGMMAQQAVSQSTMQFSDAGNN